MRVTKHDDALWLKHLAEVGMAVPLGRCAVFAVNDIEVLFEPMRRGSDGRQPHGLRAAGANRPVWTEIPLREVVELRLVRVLESMSAATTTALPQVTTSTFVVEEPLASTRRISETITLTAGRQPTFDAYITVDWSASSVAKDGKDSVWWCLGEWNERELVVGRTENPRTRRACADAVRSELASLAAADKSVLVGFDFPFGYPTGFADALRLRGAPWRAVWADISRRIDDQQSDGVNNRFAVASEINEAVGAPEGPFWGCPDGRDYEHLLPTAPVYPVAGLARLRMTEGVIRGPQPTWKLWGNGSVGGQALLGIPYLVELRENAVLSSVSRVWPFETGAILPPRNAGPQIILAEIYPSLISLPSDLGDHVKDRVQVEMLARHFARHDGDDTIDALFEAPRALPTAARRTVVEAEGWILGVVPRPS